MALFRWISLLLYVMRIDSLCFGDDNAVLLLSYSISSGALESPDLLPSYSIIASALHNTIILIIAHL